MIVLINKITAATKKSRLNYLGKMHTNQCITILF